MAAVALNSQAQTQAPRCLAPFQKLLGLEVFAHYPARKAIRELRPASPDVRTGQAHLYRTVIREEAKSGPNFAGHYTLVPIGCGAATSCLAIVDAITGAVYFPTNLRSATALLMDTGKDDVQRLNYKLESRLLIVAGEPKEDEERAGLSYYLWGGGKLTLVRFLPAAKFCRSA